MKRLRPLLPDLPRRRWLLALAAVPALALPPAVAATNLAAVPIGRMDLPWWRKRFAASLAQLKGANPQVVWLGDSITQNWERDGSQPWARFAPIWQREYGRYGALNMGFIGDTTASVLWRLDHGQVAGIDPKVVILLIGANNLGRPHWGAELTVPGIEAVVNKLRQLLPHSRVLLLGILPSRRSAWISEQTARINAALAQRYAGDPVVRFFNAGDVLLGRNGQPDPQFYLEGHDPKATVLLHPDAQGMERIAQAIAPTLEAMLAEPRP